jgi:PAS domain S-box-containing protein
VAEWDDEDQSLRSAALQNADSILLARQRADDELLRTREALRESQERLRAALTAAGTSAFRWDLRHHTVDWDGSLDRLFGLEPGQTTQSFEAFIAAVHRDDQARVRAHCERCSADGSEFDVEFRVVAPDRRVRWISGKAKASFDANGAPMFMTGVCADITSRKQVAELLRENEERLRAIFNQAAVGIAITTLNGRFIDVNQRFSDILGYAAAELESLTFFDITHPDDLAETTIAVRQLLDGVIPDYSIEKRYLRKDGSQVWSLSTVTLLKDVADEPQRFIGVIEDISSRKHAEAALREQSRLLELLNETGTVLASSLDLNAAAQAVTDAATQLSGAQFGAFFYNSPDDSGDAFILHSVSGAPRQAFEKSGAANIRVLFGPNFRGQTSLRCDDVLKATAEEALPFQHGLPDAVPVRSCLAVPVGSRSGELIGGLFFGHAEPNVFTDRVERLIVGVAAQAGIAIDNARLFEAAQRAAEERKLLLERERAARTEAERMSEMKDEFLATLSHELRTPLNAILGWSQVLRTGDKAQADYLKGLETIERNARVQTQLIEDLLDMSRITSGKLRLDIQPLLPASFIEAAIETVKHAADANGIRIEKVLDPAAGPIAGDPGRLQQVIWNLLSNAIKFTPKNGRIEVRLERVNSHIEISVADSGIGIKPEFLPFLFERFRQADASTTRKYGGLGLGLSIVKNLIELHGGIVEVSSPGTGLGTTVTVHLPLTAVHRSAELVERLQQKPLGSYVTTFIPAELAGLKVLVVDDQADARDLIKRILEDCAAEVLTAATAAEAVAVIEATRPDILVTDIGMPDADGFELLRRVRALGPERGGTVHAIALTAFARSEDRTRALRAGFQVHVAKPVDPSELVATVASVAGRVNGRGAN